MKSTQAIRVLMVLAGAMLPVMTSGTAHAGMMLKGGTTRFTSGLDKVTSPGVAWGIVYGFKPASFVSIEIGSEGSRNVVNDPESPDTTALLRLGETTLVKFALPVLPVVHPFVGVGLSLDYIIVQGGQLSIPIPGMPGQSEARYNSGMFVHFPLAAGIDFDFSAVTLGIRATYHYSAASPFPKDVNPNFLDLAATVGVAF